MKDVYYKIVVEMIQDHNGCLAWSNQQNQNCVGGTHLIGFEHYSDTQRTAMRSLTENGKILRVSKWNLGKLDIDLDTV